jgi:hypothetical protein
MDDIDTEYDLMPCDKCGSPTSFEGPIDNPLFGGQMCDVCDEWCCDLCIQWDKCLDGFTVCVQCAREYPEVVAEHWKDAGLKIS